MQRAPPVCTSYALRVRLHGFSPIEMLVVLALTAVLLAVGVSWLGGLMADMRVRALSDRFQAALLLARSEAIKRNARVVLCASADGQQCSSGDWEQGWIVFHDANDSVQRESGEALLLVQSASSGKARMWGNANVSHYVSFNGAGITRLQNGAFQAGTITACVGGRSNQSAREIRLAATGNARALRVQRASCP
jgi:type IV fimbrial biogenesis protein FimT